VGITVPAASASGDELEELVEEGMLLLLFIGCGSIVVPKCKPY
jgi:hypothetical protein